MNIVAVDDEEAIRVLIEVLLEAGHHDTVTYESVIQAKAHDWSTADVAIVDLMMPGISGDELLHWLSINYPDVRRVICTAKGPSDISERYGHLAHDIVSKPFTGQQLEAAIHG